MKEKKVPYFERYNEAESLTEQLTLRLHDDLLKQEEIFDVVRDHLKNSQLKLDKDLISRFKDLRKDIANTRKNLRDLEQISRTLEYCLEV